MNTYSILLFTHVLAATALVGGSIVAAPLVHIAVRRARSLGDLRAALGLGAPLRFINPTASLLVIASGVYLTTLLHWWQMGWVQVAAVLWLVNVVTAARVVAPRVGPIAAAAMAAGDGPVTDEIDRLRRSSRWAAGIAVLVANDVTSILLMTMKPGFTPAVLVVAAAHATLWGGVSLLAAFRGGLVLRRAGAS